LVCSETPDGSQTRMTHPSDQPEFLRLLFTTPLGTTRSVEVGYDSLTEVVRDGVFIDGSSVGYAAVNSSDLLLRPSTHEPIREPWDPSAAVLLCGVHDTSGAPHMCDPRNVLNRVVTDAAKQGVTLRVGPEIEFFLVWKTLGNGIVTVDQGSYCATRPSDGALGLRREIARTLSVMGIPTTAHHHEVAAGQQEIGLAYESAPEIADRIMLARLAITELAYSKGMVATFMPKPFAGKSGSGMHLHLSLWDEQGSNLFASGLEGTVSNQARHYLAGIMEHASALSAIVAPTVNSFKRLRPGFEAPTRIAWGPRNRTTMIRIPQFNGCDKKARIEFRCPDPSCSPHLAIAAVLAAGLDGVAKNLEPPAPTSEDLYHVESETPSLPGTLIEALHCLQEDRVLRRALGEAAVDYIVRLRTAEWRDYVSAAAGQNPPGITDWEIEKYLFLN